MNASEIRATLAPFLKVTAALKQIDEMAETVVLEQARVQQLQKQRGEFEQAVGSLKSQHDFLAQQITQRKQELDALSAAITTAHATNRSLTAEHEGHLQTTKAAIAKAQHDHQVALDAATAAHKKDLETVISQHAQAVKDLEKVKAARADLLASLR